MAFTLVGCLLLIPFKKNRFNLRFALILLPLYIIMGLLQQLFFQYLFLDTVKGLIGSLWLTILAGAVFFALFHLGIHFTNFFRICLFFTFIIWGYFYLTYQNIFWLAISHGIIGTVYYALIVQDDPIRHRLSKKVTSKIAKY
jgi:chromate transport protein ChrA